MFSARLPSVPELLFGSSSFASIGRAIIWTSISKGGYLGCAAWAKAADSSRYPNTLFSAYRHLKDSADHKKPTIADYCLTFSTRCNASSCAISMPAEVFVLTLCSDDMLHCGPDQHNRPCLATKMDKADMAFRCSFRLFSNNFGNEFLETQLSQQSSSDSKWVLCGPTAIALLAILPPSLALSETKIGST